MAASDEEIKGNRSNGEERRGGAKETKALQMALLRLALRWGSVATVPFAL